MDEIRPDLLLLQELWELELQTQRWVHKYEVVEGVKGIGQGLAAAVATHLMSPEGELRISMDVPDVLLAGFQSVAGTLWVVGSVYLRPKSSYKEKMDRLKEIAATLEVVRPAGVLLGGDLCWPVSSARPKPGRGWAFRAWERVRSPTGFREGIRSIRPL